MKTEETETDRQERKEEKKKEKKAKCKKDSRNESMHINCVKTCTMFFYDREGRRCFLLLWKNEKL